MSEDVPPDAVEVLMAEILMLPASERREAVESACRDGGVASTELRRRMAIIDSIGFPSGPSQSKRRSWSLSTGDKLGVYEIRSSLGAGGMGEVYVARDSRLDRDVAIKVLSESFAQTPERFIRFEREAKALAALNHPNIGQIHTLDQIDGLAFLVLELVSGEDLSTRLEQGGLQTSEAIEFAQLLASGLEAAHDAGVIHRDLKPANIRLSVDGSLKILDFGLAKSTPSLVSDSDTPLESENVKITRSGAFIGTPIYMSPEQARGRTVDRRADVWSFGCVFFECLTGVKPFMGSNLGDLVAQIIGQEPDWSLLPADLPPQVLWLLKRCLEKDPRRRLRDMGEARICLADAEGYLPEPDEELIVRAENSSRISLWLLPVAMILTLAVSFKFFRQDELLARTRQLSVFLDLGQELSSGAFPNVVISEDGQFIAWSGGKQRSLMVRSLDDFRVRKLTGTAGATSPFFSPDGKWLGYFVEHQLFKVSTGGGAPVLILAEKDYSEIIHSYETKNRGGCWSSDGWIVFCPSIRDGLFRVRCSGESFERLTTIDAKEEERTHRWPQLLPGGEAVIFTVDDQRSPESYADAHIEIVELQSGERRVLVEGASFARFANGLLYFARGSSLFHQKFDPSDLKPHDNEELLVEVLDVDLTSGAAQFHVSNTGTLVFAPGQEGNAARRLVWREQSGEISIFDLPSSEYSEPSISPNDRRVSYVVATDASTDIWIHDLDRGTNRRLTTTGSAFSPIWSPDGKRIFFHSRFPSGMYSLPADGSGEAETLLASTVDRALPTCFSADGSELFFTWREGANNGDIMKMNLDDHSLVPVVATDASEGSAALSPNGKWLAFYSDTSGQKEVYIQPIEPGGRRWQVSSSGGFEPRWSRDGKTIFFLSALAGELWAVNVKETQDDLELGSPHLVLTNFCSFLGEYSHYALGPDGQFLSVTAASEQGDFDREIRVLEGLGSHL